MQGEKLKKIISWTAIIISLSISSFWAYWGIEEFFHEGWYSDSFLYALFLFFVQYLLFAIIFTILALIAMKYRRVGLGAYILLGLFSAFFFSGASFQVAYLSLAIPFVILGLLFYFGEFIDFKRIKIIMIFLPILIIFILETPLLWRNINRVDDKNYAERLIDCQGEKIIWAGRGLGFPGEGVNWTDADYTCRHLSEDASYLADEELSIWRLPSIEEAVQCQMRNNENSSGVWNSETKKAIYEKMPDKETPLWQPSSEIIYYWTSELSKNKENQAYIFTYDGGIRDKDTRYAPNYQSFRCVKDYNEETEVKNGSINREEAITSYLESQENFAWQTEKGSKNICVFDNLSGEDSLFPLSLWVYCREYKLQEGEIIKLSGSSGPVLIDYPNELSYFSPYLFSYQSPRDGKLYYEDIQKIFPDEVQNEIFTYSLKKNLEGIWEEQLKLRETL